MIRAEKQGESRAQSNSGCGQRNGARRANFRRSRRVLTFVPLGERRYSRSGGNHDRARQGDLRQSQRRQPRGARRLRRGDRRRSPASSARRIRCASPAPRATASATIGQPQPRRHARRRGARPQRHRRRRQRRGRRGARRLPGLEPHALGASARGSSTRAADIIRERRYELSVWLIWEMGKNRVEALGEIEETADLLTYYAAQMRENRGFVREMDKLAPTDRNVSVLRPYGVWAVIAPWNFPYALMGAPAAAALRDRQHRGDEAVVGDAALGAEAVRDLRGGGPAAGNDQLRHRRRPHRRRHAGHAPRRRRRDLHRARSTSGSSSSTSASRRSTRSRASSRWAARTRRSSWTAPTSTAPCRASTARRSA